MRGGQITIFVVVGLVLLFTIGLFYAVISLSSQTDPNETTDVAILSSTIASCVDSVVAAELRQLGEQGGLAEFEGWPHATVDNGRSQRIILFGITENTDELLPRTYALPRYPDTGVTFDTMEQDIRTGREFIWFQDGYFGDVNFPAICQPEGPNNARSNIACRFYPGNPPNAPGPSVQEGLEQRINQRVQACASPSAFEKVMGQKVQKVGDPDTEVTFTRTNTIVALTYPLELQGGSTTQKFTRTYDVRFLSVMQFAIDLARADTRNARFDVEEDAHDLASYRGGFSVIRSEAVFTDANIAVENADLITIIDRESVLDGTSFTFSFLAAHRPPMLDHVTDVQWGDFYDVGVLGADPDDGPVQVRRCFSAGDCGPGPIPGSKSRMRTD